MIAWAIGEEANAMNRHVMDDPRNPSELAVSGKNVWLPLGFRTPAAYRPDPERD